MYIRRLIIRHFRGFSSIKVKPSGNVVLMGEPGVGRSDIINAISKVLDPNVIDLPHGFGGHEFNRPIIPSLWLQ